MSPHQRSEVTFKAEIYFKMYTYLLPAVLSSRPLFFLFSFQPFMCVVIFCGNLFVCVFIHTNNLYTHTHTHICIGSSDFCGFFVCLFICFLNRNPFLRNTKSQKQAGEIETVFRLGSCFPFQVKFRVLRVLLGSSQRSSEKF